MSLPRFFASLLLALAATAPWSAQAQERKQVEAGASRTFREGDGKAWLAYRFAALPFRGGVAVPALELVGYAGAAHGDARRKFAGAGVQGAVNYQFDAFTLSGRAGMGYTRASTEPPGVRREREKRLGFLYGLGTAYAVTDNWSVHIDWDRVPVRYNGQQKATVDLFSLGLSYRF